MKERFREFKETGTVKWRFKDDEGISRYFIKTRVELVNKIIGIVREYMRQNIKLSLRQLYYQLVANAIIPNAQEIYKRIGDLVSDMRYGGLLDWDSIEDRGRVPERHAQWNTVKDLVESAIYSYRLPRWKNQDFYVECYCEKQSLESVLQPVCDEYHIYFGCNKGYSSSSAMYELAQRLKKELRRGKKVILLYLGDHDASGLDMRRDIRERLLEFISEGDDPMDTQSLEDSESEDIGLDVPVFDVFSIALNMEQIRKYNPPPNPAKTTDPRAKAYIDEFGEHSWELDSMKPEIMQKIVRKELDKYLDRDKYDAVIKKEEKHKEKLEEFAETLDNEDEEDENEED